MLDLAADALALADRVWGAPQTPIVDRAHDAPYWRDVGPWLVLVTEPHREKATEKKLISDQINAYCPIEPRTIPTSYKKTYTAMRPMLVGYVFSRWDGSASQLSRIHAVESVVRVLQVNNSPAKVPHAAIMHLRHKQAESMKHFLTRKNRPRRESLKIGAWVQVVDHFAFTGLPGQVVGFIDGRNRIRLEIERFFGRHTPCEVSANQVRAL